MTRCQNLARNAWALSLSRNSWNCLFCAGLRPCPSRAGLVWVWASTTSWQWAPTARCLPSAGRNDKAFSARVKIAATRASRVNCQVCLSKAVIWSVPSGSKLILSLGLCAGLSTDDWAWGPAPGTPRCPPLFPPWPTRPVSRWPAAPPSHSPSPTQVRLPGIPPLFCQSNLQDCGSAFNFPSGSGSAFEKLKKENFYKKLGNCW